MEEFESKIQIEDEFLTVSHEYQDFKLTMHSFICKSATGTGKTYLSAFDVKEVNPKKFLFIVHRGNIAKTAMKSYIKVFGKSKSMGM